MDKIKRFLPTKRRLIQLYAAMLCNANLKGFCEGRIYTGGAKNVCVPGLNCYSCPGAVGACPLGSLQNALAASPVRAPYYVLGLLMLFGLTLGRVICGFLCPMGLIQELLHKIPTPKIRKGRLTKALSWMKYAVLIVFVVLLPLGYALRSVPLPAFCKFICPAGTLEGAVGLLAHPDNAENLSMLGGLFTWKFSLMVALGAACVFCWRAFCRFVCPLGALYGLFSRIALLGVKLDRCRCVDCGKCVAVCPVDIGRVGDHECVQCGRCVEACPVDAIRWKGPKVSRRGRVAAWAAALAALVCALWYFNRPLPEEAPPVAVEAGVGSEVGMRCPDFTVPLYDGGTFSVADARGKTVVLNFWATWCTPCVAELPYFEQLLENHSGEIAMAVIHSDLVTEDVPAYLEKAGFDLPFALDETGEVIASLGGSTMLPMTVVLDENGVITYSRVGSVTYDMLEELIAPE